MGKRASQYFKGSPVVIGMGEKQLRNASGVEMVGGARMQLHKVRATGQLVLSETRFFEAATTLKEALADKVEDKIEDEVDPNAGKGDETPNPTETDDEPKTEE